MPALNLMFERTADVSKGMMSQETTESRMKFIFNKNVFVPGEVAFCRIICDNSACANNVFGLKLKLLRKLIAKPGDNSRHRDFSRQFIHLNVKELGECAAGEKTDRTLMIRIPTEIAKLDAGLSDIDAILRCSPNPTTISKHCSVEYTLSAYLKHEKTSGSGTVASIPITIVIPVTQ